MKNKKSFGMCFSFTAFIAAAALFITACGSGSSQEPETPETMYRVGIERAFVTSNYEGDVLVINLDVVNNSEEYLDSYSVVYDLSVKLDGQTLSDGYLSGDDENYIEDEKIAPGEEGTAQAVYSLNGSEEGEISVIGVSYTLEDYVQTEVLNETLDLSLLERITIESNFEFSLDKAVVTDNGEGGDEKFLVLDMTFTNNSQETTSFGYSIETELFQDGIGLDNGYLSYKHPYNDEDLEDNCYTEIQSGKSIQVRRVYELNDSVSPVEFHAVDDATGYVYIELYSCEIQIDESNPASSENVVVAEKVSFSGDDEYPDDPAGTITPTPSETPEQKLSGSYVDFDDMSFYVNGVKYTLGKTTLQEMIDDGVPFSESDLQNAENNLNSNYQSSGFRIELAQYYTALVYVLNDTDSGKPMNECYINEIYLPLNSDKQQDILSFAFPLDITMDELTQNAGDPDDTSHYEDGDYYSDDYEYTKDSTQYFSSSSYTFEYINGELTYFTMQYMP